MSPFPVTSATLIGKIKSLPPGADNAAWVRFWDSYSDAIRIFAARKGGEDRADDIVMTVLGKLVDVLREGKYAPEKGAFHSYLSAMIINEVRMQNRKDKARAADRRVSIDAPVPGDCEDGGRKSAKTIGDTIPAEPSGPDSLDEDWKKAILESATAHILEKTAISKRDRAIYMECTRNGRSIEETAEKYGLSRNLVSQIKTRINRRIVAVGRELASRFGEI